MSHQQDKIIDRIKSFGKEKSGSIGVWAALMSPVLIGGGALSVDIARLQNMDNELQSAADALARVGAAELDQRSDSLTRATRAIQTLISNDQRFSKDGRAAVEIATIRYLKTLPTNDHEDIINQHMTVVPSEARFVEVTTKPETVNTFFPASFLSSVTSVQMSAQSVAGFDQMICGTAPVFFCNPAEGTSDSIYDLMEDPSFLRRQVQFKVPGGNSQYGPGNFGYLDPFDSNSGASVITDAIAIDKTNACYSKSRGVRLRPGNIASVSHGFNTRFDIYKGSYKKKRTDPRYAPAANVVKGYSGKNSCSTTPSGDAYGMPNDKCFENGACTEAGGRMGNGDWDFIEYMKINHNYMSNITIEGTTYRINYNNNSMTPAEPPSRYVLYRWEIENDCVPGPKTYGKYSGTEEEGLPTCHASGPSTTVDDRRVIQAALLNCAAIEASGQSMAGRTDYLPVETFVKVFLTEPMGSGQDNIIWGEIIGPVVQGEDSVSNDQIALAR
jgi:Flp pilus assembly protein TadG